MRESVEDRPEALFFRPIRAIYLSLSLYIYICIYTYVYTYIHIFVHMYTCVCTYIYIYIYMSYTYIIRFPSRVAFVFGLRLLFAGQSVPEHSPSRNARYDMIYYPIT